MISGLRCTAADGTNAGARVVAPPAANTEKSPRALFFVHGVGSTAAIWDTQLEAFGSDYQCVAVELRGNGALRPDPDPKLITRPGFAQDVVRVADALNVEKFTLVGCSLGGVVAFELWQSVPQRLEAMVVLGSFARYPDGTRYAQNVERAVVEAGDMRTFAQRRAAQLGLPPNRLRETIEQMACKSVPCYVAATHATWTGDYRAGLSTIDIPVLVAYGEHDAIAPRALSQEIAMAVESSKLESIPAAGHIANADNPAAFNRLVRDFLSETARPQHL